MEKRPPNGKGPEFQSHHTSLLKAEYAEAGSCLRLGWEFVFNQVRHFLVFQVLLLGAIGLLGLTAQSSLINFAIATDFTESSVADSEKNGSEGTDNLTVDNERETRKVLNNWAKMIISVLGVVGFLTTLAAIRQHERLHHYLAKVITRAKDLEALLYREENNEGNSTHGLYQIIFDLQDEIKHNRLNVHSVVSTVYYVFVLLWLFVLIMVILRPLFPEFSV